MADDPAEETAGGRFEPETPPNWHPDEDERRRMLAAFRTETILTLGLEEELMLLDAATLDIVPAAATVLGCVDGDPRFRPEIRAGQIEIVTPVAGNARAAGLHLARARIDLQHRLESSTLIGASGTHPFSSNWGPVTDDDRYRRLAEEYGQAVAGNVPSGLHVHVGFESADRCLAVYNAVRSYLPEIAALAANSPYADGADSGLACARRPLTGAFHRSGIPPVLPT
jgi:glutamate---cysteine ligase / carboxylate-amine ligase